VTRRRFPAGFTLMEVMLALGIFGIVTTMLYGTFARTLRSKTIAEQRAEVTRLGRAALGRMADEIGSAYYPPGLVDTAIFRTLRGGTEDAPLDSLVFTALSARPAGVDGRGTDQRLLVYFFPRERSGLRRESGRGAANAGASDADANLGATPANRGGVDLLADDADDFFAAFGPSHPPILGASPHRLLRREATMIERRALDEARATVFLEDVASLNFRFHDGTDWVEEWDSEDPNSRHLPRAVRIELALYDATGAIQHFTTAVDLPMSDTPIGFGATKTPGGDATPKPTRTPKGGL
jgi:prepilin-type N-terminal cleavage/methylation domain-containing protein